MKNKKAISAVVSSVLMIAVTVSLVAVVWGVINNLVYDNIDEGTACSDVHGKIEINGRYTCYNSSSTPGELLFAINRKDIEIDSLLISIESAGKFKSLEIENGSDMSGSELSMYDGSQDPILLPEKNGGYTYRYSTSEKPDAISVAPIVDGNTCSEVDSVQGIEDCGIFDF